MMSNYKLIENIETKTKSINRFVEKTTQRKRVKI